MLQTTNKSARDESQSTQVNHIEKNWDDGSDAGSDASDDTSGGNVGRGIKNLTIVANLVKSKKSNLAKFKKSILLKDLVKINFLKADFLTPETKKAFIQQQKVFTKCPILGYFDQKYHIKIETNTLGYIIGRVLSQMTLDQHCSNQITYKNHSDLSMFKIGL